MVQRIVCLVLLIKLCPLAFLTLFTCSLWSSPRDKQHEGLYQNKACTGQHGIPVPSSNVCGTHGIYDVLLILRTNVPGYLV